MSMNYKTIALRMLEGSNETDQQRKVIFKRLDKIDKLCQKVGGKLQSRQVIAKVIADSASLP